MSRTLAMLISAIPAVLAGPLLVRAQGQSNPAEVASWVGNPQLVISQALAVPAKPLLNPRTEFSDREKFWWKPERQKAAAAAEMVLMPNPYTLVAMRLYGKLRIVWGEEEYTAATAPALTGRWLTSVKDGVFQDYRKGDWRFVPFWDLPDEYKAYCEALVKASDTPVDAFKESAKENSHVKFAHMYSEPNKHRGGVVEVTGRVRRVRRYDAPLLALDEGVKHVYEGWIFPNTPGAHPICVLFTHLPKGLPVAEDVDARVSFYGYFFKRYKYVTGEQYVGKDGVTHNRQRDTLLLIGPTLILNSAPTTPTPAEESWGKLIQLVIVVLVAGLGIGLLVILMGVLYRRADERVRQRVTDIRTTKSVAFEDEPAADPRQRLSSAEQLFGGNSGERGDGN